MALAFTPLGKTAQWGTRPGNKPLSMGSPGSGRAKTSSPVTVLLKQDIPTQIREIRLEPGGTFSSTCPRQFIKTRLTQACQSPCNTPIVPVRKPNGKYRLVQDLRAIHEVTEDIHPVVPNPCTMLSTLPPHCAWCLGSDFKRFLFCILLAIGFINPCGPKVTYPVEASCLFL